MGGWGVFSTQTRGTYLTVLDMENVQVSQTVTQLPVIPQEGNF
jgi:hypothetical protein